MKTLIFIILLCLTGFAVSQDSINDNLSSKGNGKLSSSSVNTDNGPNSGNSINWLMFSAIIGIIGSSFVWAYNEWQKRNTKLITEKEARYRILIAFIRSFGNGSEDKKSANDFIMELQQCWMYCPDAVIEKGNQFLRLIGHDQTKIDIAKGEFILEMRKDLMRSSKLFKFRLNKNRITKLKATDFMDVYYQPKSIDKID